MSLLLFVAAFAPYITVYDPLPTNGAASLGRPSWQHWLGCDFMGRDLYSRIIYGARISLQVAIGSMALGTTVGVAIGLLSGYLLGWFDLITQRFLEMMQSLPLLAMAINLAPGPAPHPPHHLPARPLPPPAPHT